MAFLGVSIKKGNFRGIRKNRQNPISGNMAIADSGRVIFQDHQKRGPNFRTTKNRPIFGGRKNGPKNPIFRTWK